MLSRSALASEVHIVEMGGSAHMFQFSPKVTYIEPGDSVLFKSVGHIHASRSIASMCSGKTGWRGQVGEDISVKFDEPGIYGFKCGAHYSLGMVGLIVVGQPKELSPTALIARHPPKAKAAFSALLKSVHLKSGAQ